MKPCLRETMETLCFARQKHPGDSSHSCALFSNKYVTTESKTTFKAMQRCELPTCFPQLK